MSKIVEYYEYCEHIHQIFAPHLGIVKCLDCGSIVDSKYWNLEEEDER